MWDGLFSATVFSGLILFGYMLAILAIALVRRDNGIVDSAYGLGFVLVTGVLFLGWERPDLRQWLFMILVALWGLRLSVRIFFKNRSKPEDFRYRAWREAWTQRSMLYFFLRSLLQIYLLQGGVILIVLAPVLVVFSQTQVALGWWNWLGLGLWCLGFFFEAVGDWQLDRFIKNPANQGKIMSTGLWSLTRHPNYFGEATMWWGIWLLVLGVSLSSVALVSPILITFLLLKVSGIPMLEAKWAGRPDWEEYKKRTNAFFPWLPKRI